MKSISLGMKLDEVGYFAFQESIRLGAPIMTGHEHSYARTKQLNDVGSNPRDFKIVPDEELAELIDGIEVQTVGPGNSHVVSNGIGGRSFRGARKQNAGRPWWQRLFNGDSSNFDYAVHVCEYNVKNRTDLAYCYLLTLDNIIADEYFIVSEN